MSNVPISLTILGQSSVNFEYAMVGEVAEEGRGRSP